MKIVATTALASLLVAAGIVLRPLIATEIPSAERRSGYTFMAPETRAMQDDDTTNPGMLGVLDGEALWNRKAGAAEKSCADCHDDARTSMKGVAARYPAYDKMLARPVNLEQRINLCRARHQDATPLPYEKHDLLALSTFVAEQSRGMPIAPDTGPELAPFVAKGRDFFMHRQGQLNIACANCHDDNWDKHLAGSAVTQAMPTGYPIYRLEWQSLGSLQRRLRNCITGMRAQNYDFGSPELVELELYLMARARGMPIETPAVRP
jgi:L-cysteine S-thiosulfotransferase